MLYCFNGMRGDRKLAKSTLVLIPLFGVHYVILLAWPDDVNNSQSHVIKLYFELSTSSIQVRHYAA